MSDGLRVVCAKIALVRRYLAQFKALFRRVIYQRLEMVVVMRVRVADFNARDNIRFDTAHQVQFEPHRLESRHDCAIHPCAKSS